MVVPLGVKKIRVEDANPEKAVAFERVVPFVDGRGAINKAKILVNPTLVQAGINDIFNGGGVTIRPKKQFQDGIDSLKDAAD